MFDAILDCLDACLIIFDRMHVVCHIFILTLMFYDSTLTLSYDQTFLFDMLFFLSHLAYLGIHDQPFNCHVSLNLVSRDLFKA